MRRPGTGEVFQNVYSGRKRYATLRASSYAQMWKAWLTDKLRAERKQYGPLDADTLALCRRVLDDDLGPSGAEGR